MATADAQPGLFDRPIPQPQPGAGTASSDRKLEGLAARATKVGSPYIDIARAVIRTLAMGDDAFTSDDVRRVLGNPTGLDPRTLGCAFRAERVEGTIRATGEWKVSVFASRNGGVVRVWQGVR